jgi:hypothetical protein
MFDRPFVLGLLVITTPAGLRAQRVNEYQDRVARLYESLVEIRRTADSARDARAHELVVDTIRTGSLVLLADPEDSLVAPAVASRLASVLRVTLGVETSLLNDVMFYPLIRPRWEHRERLRWAPPRMPGRKLEPFRVERATEDEMALRLHGAMEQWVGAKIDPAIDAWLMQPVPINRDSVSLQGTYEEFMTGISPLAAECATGDDAACRVALGLVPVEDPLMVWYDADARRELIASLPGTRRADPEAVQVCVERRWDAVCVSLLKQLGEARIPAPFSGAVRLSLLRYALALGGDRSFERLFAFSSLDDSAMGIVDALEATADMPVDSLLGVWRAAAHASAPPLVTLSLRTVIASLVWVGILLAVSLRNHRTG